MRSLRGRKESTFLNLASLVVGLTGTLLIFLFIQHHLTTDKHHRQYNKIFRVVTDLHLDNGVVENYPEAPLPLARALRADFSQVQSAAYLKKLHDLTVTIPSGATKIPIRFREKEGIALVEPELFQIFDFNWREGNPVSALTQPNSVILTESWAKKYFGGNEPVGKTIQLNQSIRVTVTGVIRDPPANTSLNFGMLISLPTLADLYPEFDKSEWGNLSSADRVFVLLKNENLKTGLAEQMPALRKKHFGEYAHYYRFLFQPLSEVHFDTARTGETTISRSIIYTMMVVGLFLMVTACFNFVNLTMAGLMQKQKEAGIRKALGSSRLILLFQPLTETLLISLTATVLSVALAAGLTPVLSQWLATPVLFEINGTLAGILVLLNLSVVLLAGLYPSFSFSVATPGFSLTRQSLTSAATFSISRILMVTQFTICQAMVIGALVVYSQVSFFRNSDPGFQKSNLVNLSLPTTGNYSLSALKHELEKVRGIESVTASSHPPSDKGMHGGQFKLKGSTDWEKYPVRERLVDTDYVKTYGLKIIAGRNLSASDTIKEYLVNEEFLRKQNISNPMDILGQEIQYHLSPVPLPIVGVVKNFTLRSLHERLEPCVIATATARFTNLGIHIRAENPGQTLDEIKKAWFRLYPQEVFEYTFLDERLASYYASEDQLLKIVSTFALLTILIGCLGLYGLVSFSVSKRTREIGIRKVLGASVGSVVALLSSNFLLLVVIAFLIATPVSWWIMNKWLANYAYRIEIPWWIPALAGLITVVTAFATASLLSVRAAIANPVKSLKNE